MNNRPGTSPKNFRQINRDASPASVLWWKGQVEQMVEGWDSGIVDPEEKLTLVALEIAEIIFNLRRSAMRDQVSGMLSKPAFWETVQSLSELERQWGHGIWLGEIESERIKSDILERRSGFKDKWGIGSEQVRLGKDRIGIAEFHIENELKAEKVKAQLEKKTKEKINGKVYGGEGRPAEGIFKGNNKQKLPIKVSGQTERNLIRERVAAQIITREKGGKMKLNIDFLNELARKLANLERNTIKDTLTGVYEKGYGIYLGQKTLEMEAYHGSTLRAYLVDLPTLREINEQQPDRRQAGDRVLKSAPRIMEEYARDRGTLMQITRWEEGGKFMALVPTVFMKGETDLGRELQSVLEDELAVQEDLDRSIQPEVEVTIKGKLLNGKARLAGQIRNLEEK